MTQQALRSIRRDLARLTDSGLLEPEARGLAERTQLGIKDILPASETQHSKHGMPRTHRPLVDLTRIILTENAPPGDSVV